MIDIRDWGLRHAVAWEMDQEERVVPRLLQTYFAMRRCTPEPNFYTLFRTYDYFAAELSLSVEGFDLLAPVDPRCPVQPKLIGTPIRLVLEDSALHHALHSMGAELERQIIVTEIPRPLQNHLDRITYNFYGGVFKA